MPGGTYFLYTPSPKGMAGGLAFPTAEAASQYLIAEHSICTVPWDDAGPHLRLSVTYEAADEAAEDALMAETEQRLKGLRLMFDAQLIAGQRTETHSCRERIIAHRTMPERGRIVASVTRDRASSLYLFGFTAASTSSPSVLSPRTGRRCGAAWRSRRMARSRRILRDGSKHLSSAGGPSCRP